MHSRSGLQEAGGALSACSLLSSPAVPSSAAPHNADARTCTPTPRSPLHRYLQTPLKAGFILEHFLGEDLHSWTGEKGFLGRLYTQNKGLNLFLFF